MDTRRLTIAIDRNTERFEQDLLEDVLPFVEQTYRVKRAPEARCLVGLSMGGGQSLTIGLRHPELFGWVGAFSAATPREEDLSMIWENVEDLNRGLHLLWIACGKDDFLLERHQEFIGLLTEKKVEHHWLLTDGDHSWPVWRHYLSEFAPLLFR